MPRRSPWRQAGRSGNLRHGGGCGRQGPLRKRLYIINSISTWPAYSLDHLQAVAAASGRAAKSDNSTAVRAWYARNSKTSGFVLVNTVRIIGTEEDDCATAGRMEGL